MTRTRAAVLGLVFVVAADAEGQCLTAGLDRKVTAVMRAPALTSNAPLRFTVNSIAFVGGYGPFVATPILLSGGADGGPEAFQALVVSSLVTGALKVTFGRARPRVSADTMPCDYRWGRGLRRDDYRSMPSGHTSAAFAFATALAAQSSARDARPFLYSGATLVGLARIYQDRHWASDVLFGAAIGIAAGAAVTR